MVVEESLTPWQDPDLLCALLQVKFSVRSIPALQSGSAGIGTVDQELPQ
jgi:hypothetical protein